jgi:magnesium transporter
VTEESHDRRPGQLVEGKANAPELEGGALKYVVASHRPAREEPQEMVKTDLNDPVTRHVRTDVVPLQAGQTVGEALARMRARPPKGRIVYFYVVDDEGRLQGVVPTRRLLLSPPEAMLADIMIRRVIAIPSQATVLDACEFFMMHRLLAFPVIDEHRRLLGVVDVELYTDELADLAQPSNDGGEGDVFQLIGVHLLQARRGSPWNAFRQRFPWLLCNVAGGVAAAFLTGRFQDMLDRLVVLALFIPVVLTLSESVGIQSLSLTIRTMHGEAVAWRDALLGLRRELLSGILLGLASGVIVGLVVWLWKGEGAVALAVFASIGLAMTASALIGMALPTGLHLLRFDPRVAAGPIALVVADLVTLLLYFSLARWLLT